MGPDVSLSTLTRFVFASGHSVDARRFLVAKVPESDEWLVGFKVLKVLERSPSWALVELKPCELIWRRDTCTYW
jgi:hypothetical protein